LWKSRGEIDFVGDLYCVFMLPLFNSKQATVLCWPTGVKTLAPSWYLLPSAAIVAASGSD
jgi:hypothetical protein